jgi:hypothetical protein
MHSLGSLNCSLYQKRLIVLLLFVGAGRSVPLSCANCRWTENWDWFVARINVTSDLQGDTFFRVTFEQSVFRDATCSAMLGRPRFYHRSASLSCTFLTSELQHDGCALLWMTAISIFTQACLYPIAFTTAEESALASMDMTTVHLASIGSFSFPNDRLMQPVPAKQTAASLPMVGSRVEGAPHKGMPLVEGDKHVSFVRGLASFRKS